MGVHVLLWCLQRETEQEVICGYEWSHTLCSFITSAAASWVVGESSSWSNSLNDLHQSRKKTPCCRITAVTAKFRAPSEYFVFGLSPAAHNLFYSQFLWDMHKASLTIGESSLQLVSRSRKHGAPVAKASLPQWRWHTLSVLGQQTRRGRHWRAKSALNCSSTFARGKCTPRHKASYSRIELNCELDWKKACVLLVTEM